jgi:hypothetical protein
MRSGRANFVKFKEKPETMAPKGEIRVKNLGSY